MILFEKRRAAGAGRRGFTLIELLVVLAITVLLMGILFVPLSRALDLTSRGRAKSQGLDSVRTAMRRVTRDLANAMIVYPPQDLALWGYDSWSFARNRPRPAPNAQPERYLIRNGLVAFRLPKHQYYDPVADHYVTPQDIANQFGPGTEYDYVALNTCPRPGHEANELEIRPLAPMEPDHRLTLYFIGLKNPGYPLDGPNGNRQGSPLYENLLLFGRRILPNPGSWNNPNALNTYTLWRVEFDPRDPRFGNFLVNGQPNPDFFYDTRTAPNGEPYWRNWLNAARDVIDSESADMVRWVETNGKFVPHALVTFAPTPVEDEVAQPNREPWESLANGSITPGELAPLEYTATHGHWLGMESDGAAPIPNGVFVGNTLPPPQQGVRIQILARGSTSGSLTPVFDSASALRNRLVGFDSTTGRVQTAFPRLGDETGPYRENYRAVLDSNSFTVDLGQDVETAYNGMPSSFGALLAVPALQPTALIVPGSEVVQEAQPSGADPNELFTFEPLRRVGWTGLGAGRDRIVAQADLGEDEYSIDYRTGIITLSDRDPNRWTSVLTGQSVLLVKYRIQTNLPDDVVRVSYATRELLTVNLGLVQYTRRNQEALPFEVSERVVVRNLKR